MAASLRAAIAEEPSTVVTASDHSSSYSTGKSGSRLRWVAQRPEDSRTSHDASEVKAVQYTTPTPAAPKATNGNTKNALPAAPKNNLRQSFSGKELEDSTKSQTHTLMDKCPSPKDLKNIRELTTNIKPPEGELPHDCPLGNDKFQPRSFSQITYTWTASALCHKPLYFEDVQLERYGHMAGPWVQPFASAANFFFTIPILPYKMGLELPNECMYTLGWYRPGNCAPYLFDPLPISVRGMFFEAGAWVGGIYAFP